MSSGSERKLRSFVPIMAVPPAVTDLENNATDRPDPTSTLGTRRHANFNRLARFRNKCRHPKSPESAHGIVIQKPFRNQNTKTWLSFEFWYVCYMSSEQKKRLLK